MPRYNIFAELANRVQINREQYLAQNPQMVAQMNQANKAEEVDSSQQISSSARDDTDEALPALGAKALTEAFFLFVKRVGPLVSVYETVHGLITIKDTRDTVSFLCVATYAIIYQETVMLLAPCFPILVILFIFYNYYYEVKFTRPKSTYKRNMKLIQMIMQTTGDSFEV